MRVNFVRICRVEEAIAPDQDLILGTSCAGTGVVKYL